MIHMLLITANLGKVMEGDKEAQRQTLVSYCQQMFQSCSEYNADFVGIHFQEVGGLKKEIDQVDFFAKQLMDVFESQYWVSGFFFMRDPENIGPDGFTAIGNVYFVKRELLPVMKWYNWKEGRYEALPEHVEGVYNDKYWSLCHHQKIGLTKARKGFLRTRWEIGGKEMDMFNIHLFHDENNVIASEESPTRFATKRADALQETITACGVSSAFPTFFYGDFNFRLELSRLAPALRKREWHRDGGEATLDLGEKTFVYSEMKEVFANRECVTWVKKFEEELKRFNAEHNNLFREFTIDFPPTFPFDCSVQQFMGTRAPGYCDRVFLTEAVKQLLAVDNKKMGPEASQPYEWQADGNVKYTSMDSFTVGDHKPVALSCWVQI
eukprot:GFYU01002207.1.p1 GENE.GFYU01002207.1~~GFYU01002207.1.p1  ORF type:complete len:381 (-),score=71.94 GFYU01002207.1:318-1460(-)